MKTTVKTCSYCRERARVVIGVDPGATQTGLVVRQASKLWASKVITATEAKSKPPFQAVLNWLVDFIDPLPFGLPEGLDATCCAVLAVEDLNHPNPHMGLANIKGLLGTAMMVGAILSRWPDALMVPPGGHGKAPLNAYPGQLRPKSGKGGGYDSLRHARSAWDVSLAAEQILRRGAV